MKAFPHSDRSSGDPEVHGGREDAGFGPCRSREAFLNGLDLDKPELAAVEAALEKGTRLDQSHDGGQTVVLVHDS